MKYSVEFQDGNFIEILKINSHAATRKWTRVKDSIDIETDDDDFDKQFANVMDEETCCSIRDCFDEQPYVEDMDDFIMLTQLDDKEET